MKEEVICVEIVARTAKRYLGGVRVTLPNGVERLESEDLDDILQGVRDLADAGEFEDTDDWDEGPARVLKGVAGIGVKFVATLDCEGDWVLAEVKS